MFLLWIDVPVFMGITFYDSEDIGLENSFVISLAEDVGDSVR